MTATSATPTTPGYALDSAWHAERERLNSLTRLYDPGTLDICHRLGVGDGWRCLDVGAGTGAVATALVELTAPAGHVTALDIDTRFLEPLASERLEVVSSDVTSEPLPADGFDLVHARLVLEHLPERDAVLPALVGATRPGGWVLVEDFDWSTALMVDPPSETYDRVAIAIREVFESHGYAPSYGRTLPHRLADAGLTDVNTRAQAIAVHADPVAGAPQWELLARQFAPALLAGGVVTQEDLDAFHALWHDGRTLCFSPLMVSCWGRRPA